jgi:2-keto-4-pentenoate hydratase
MEKQQILEMAQVLVKARRETQPIDELPLKPATVAEAHAIQDEVTRLLGEPVGAFKAFAPPGDEPSRGPIYARTIRPSPTSVPVAEAPDCGVEGEVAFRFTRDLPQRSAPYSRDEVADALEACAAIEVITSRFRDQSARGMLEKLADCMSNGGFVYAAPVPRWRHLDLAKIHVTLEVNGSVQLEQDGGHPINDPLAVAVALANMQRTTEGVRAGMFVTCGSYIGMRFLHPGDRCAVRFEGLGTAELTFVP